jgi:DNA-binding helix-hairpin-helix protein with protein kinase domain
MGRTGVRLQLESSGQCITVEGPPAALGGEAFIYTVRDYDDLVAKVYHRPTPDRAGKLATMIAAPPVDPMAAHGQPSIAWPRDRLLSTEGDGLCVGYVMPRVTSTRSVFEFYNPRTRRQSCPLFTYRYLIRTARNLATAFRALHERGYVVGDVNESNILVTETALVTMVDTDSFQVPEGNRVHRCPVGKPEFTPPELQNVSFREVDRTPEHDAFGLAVIVFLLLMEGTHPFAGRLRGSGDPALLGERIAAGEYPYRLGTPCHYDPMPLAPPMGLLHPAVRTLLRRCFENGHTDPAVRPNAGAWIRALEEAESNLRICAENPQHLYRIGMGTCPWCERTKLLRGSDPYPSRETVRLGEHLRPPVQIKAPPQGGEK